jgi:hypothetical protein
MSRTLLLLDMVLGAAALLLAGYIARELTAPVPEPMPVAARPASRAVPAEPVPAPLPPPAAYSVVATRNLFSPTRSETPPTPVAAGAGLAAQLPRPNLYGVVLRDGAPIAYLEDPVTKRVAGYRIGDAIAGGTLKSIAEDRVVLARPEGQVDVRLHDPTRPRPAPPAAAPAPGRGPVAPSATVPAIPAVPSVTLPAPPPVAEEAQRPAPGVEQSPSSILQPGRRVLPPNLRRRVPPGSGTDATSR